MRQTPLPLLRFLPPNELVIRCGLCKELVLARECCVEPTSAMICPRRSALEQPQQAAGGAPQRPHLGSSVRFLNA